MARLPRTRRGDVMAAATQLRDQLGFSDDEQIDIFDAIRDVGVWLTFQPMDRLLGATLSAGAGGIIVTTQRDVAMQRFTAAHELGHYTLHRDEDRWDFEDDVEANPADIKEQEANIFASHFLLPRALLNQRLRDYKVSRDSDVPPAVVYLISRDLGLSYAATVSRVAEVRNLSSRARDRLQRVRPIEIKRELLHGREPDNLRAQVWLPAIRENLEFTVDVGDEMFADLPENPSTGYRWMRPEASASGSDVGIDGGTDAGADPDELQSPLSTDPVSMLDDDWAPALTAAIDVSDAGHVMGRQGVRRLHFRAENEGEWTERMLLRRPFEPEDLSVDSVELHATIRPQPATLSSRFNTQVPELDAE